MVASSAVLIIAPILINLLSDLQLDIAVAPVRELHNIYGSLSNMTCHHQYRAVIPCRRAVARFGLIVI
nr:MAG TPA: hypothetical protein [Caudoviricetes sp.]DAQ49237.1 MAG TPA: hypothetical protein [Caudoviricetes sp.]